MATKKSAGTSRNGRNSEGRRLGVKKSDGSSVIIGNIIVRQRGTKIHAGKNVGVGKDHTIFAMINGIVKFATKRKFKIVSVVAPLKEGILRDSNLTSMMVKRKTTKAKSDSVYKENLLPKKPNLNNIEEASVIVDLNSKDQTDTNKKTVKKTTKNTSN